MSSQPQDRTCPDCGYEMAFSPDGLGLLCERCGHRHRLSFDLPPITELARAQSLLSGPGDISPQRAQGVRVVLRQGVAAVKSGATAEAYGHLRRVILANESSDTLRARAWLWLSELYEAPDDKRLCLEQALVYEPGNGTARRGLALLDGRLQAADIVDPNTLTNDAAPEPQSVRVAKFTCPRCAGRMNYAADGQTLRCDYCGYTQKPDEQGETAVQPEFGIGQMEQDFIAAMAQAAGHLQPVATRTFQCDGCAREFVLAPETLSLTCPYCDHVYVTETHETRQILPPQAIIPFALSRDQAAQRVRHWFQKHDLSIQTSTPLHGLYLPVWTFDISGDLPWKGIVRRGDDWVPRSGIGHIMHDDQLVPAAGKKPAKVVGQSLADFDLSKLVAYDARYLADWPAERYQVALADASLLARRDILSRLRRHPHKLTAGEDVRQLTFNTANLTILSFKLILLPLYLLHYTHDGTDYDVTINGQNGRIRGGRPRNILGKLFSWISGKE